MVNYTNELSLVKLVDIINLLSKKTIKKHLIWIWISSLSRRRCYPLFTRSSTRYSQPAWVRALKSQPHVLRIFLMFIHVSTNTCSTLVNFSDRTGTGAFFDAITRLGMALFQPQILGGFWGGEGGGRERKMASNWKILLLGNKKRNNTKRNKLRMKMLFLSLGFRFLHTKTVPTIVLCLERNRFTVFLEIFVRN